MCESDYWFHKCCIIKRELDRLKFEMQKYKSDHIPIKLHSEIVKRHKREIREYKQRLFTYQRYRGYIPKNLKKAAFEEALKIFTESFKGIGKADRRRFYLQVINNAIKKEGGKRVGRSFVPDSIPSPSWENMMRIIEE